VSAPRFGTAGPYICKTERSPTPYDSCFQGAGAAAIVGWFCLLCVLSLERCCIREDLVQKKVKGIKKKKERKRERRRQRRLAKQKEAEKMEGMPVNYGPQYSRLTGLSMDSNDVYSVMPNGFENGMDAASNHPLLVDEKANNPEFPKPVPIPVHHTIPTPYSAATQRPPENAVAHAFEHSVPKPNMREQIIARESQDPYIDLVGGRNRAQTTETMTTTDFDDDDFIIGDAVECRLRVNPKVWKRGVITSIDPLKAKPDNHKRSFKCIEVRRATKIKGPQPAISFPQHQIVQKNSQEKRKLVRSSQQSSTSGSTVLDSLVVVPNNRLPGRRSQRLFSESSVSELEPEPNYGQPVPYGMDSEDRPININNKVFTPTHEVNEAYQVGKPVYDFDSSVFDELTTSPTISHEEFHKELDEAYKKQNVQNYISPRKNRFNKKDFNNDSPNQIKPRDEEKLSKNEHFF